MPLSSQFQLSLELTNLIPFSASNIVNFARALQRSGSDLVAEEDLVQIFGRNRLEERFESTFKAVVHDSSQQSIISQAIDIVIEGGAGPTLQRALKHREHFSTIVQLSMLTWVHERRSLASALISAMRRRIQGAPTGENNFSIPGETALLGFLKSCEEQTGTFPWQRWFDAVRLKLGIEGRDTDEELNAIIPINVLQGSLDMLTAVQSFPEDRLIYIQSHRGFVTMVVWAHCLLGLAVSVQMESVTINFGDENANVIIDATNSHDRATVCLFDASHELVLEIGDDDEGEEIESDVKYPAKGYGARILKRATHDMAVVSEMAHFSSAIAWSVAQRLRIVDSPAMILGPLNVQALESLKPFPYAPQESKYPSRKHTLRRHEALPINEVDLQSAESFLFDGIEIDRNLVGIYISTIAKAKSKDSLTFPSMINGFLRIEPDLPLQLALVMLAFSNIGNLSECGSWRLGTLQTVSNARITKFIIRGDWIGEEPIPLSHDDWYQVLGSMMLGNRCWSVPETITHTSVISNWGWTMWMSSFGEPCDPIAITPGVLTVRHGVPSRNGERRHSVVDGPSQGPSGKYSEPYETSGEKVMWRCVMETEFKSHLIAVRPDHFLVSIRSVIGKYYFSRGYRELHRLRWNAWTVPECIHDSNAPVELLPDTATVRDLICTNDPGTPRVCVSLVRGNQAARWGAMAGSLGLRNIVLASSQNCLGCVLNCVCNQDKELKWLIVS